MTRFLNRLGLLWLGLVLVFLYAPILVMAAMSLNESAFYALPFKFSTQWYEKLFQNPEILAASWRSVWIACVVTVLATTLGTLASIALYRHQFPGKRLLQTLLFPPIAIPWLITGTAMLVFFFGIGLGRGTPAVILGHVALALPTSSSLSAPASPPSTPRWKRPPVAGRPSLHRHHPRHRAPHRPRRHRRCAIRLCRQLRPVRRQLLPVGTRRHHPARPDLHRHPQGLHPRDQRHLHPHHPALHGRHAACRPQVQLRGTPLNGRGPRRSPVQILRPRKGAGHITLTFPDGGFFGLLGPSGGQDHAPPRHRGLRHPRSGPRLHRRPAGRTHPRRRPPDRHGVPVLRPVPQHDRGREHLLRP